MVVLKPTTAPSLKKRGVYKKVIIVSIRTSLNNIFLTALTKRGSVLFWTSAGGSGFKGPRRATPLAAEQTGRRLSDRLQAAGFGPLVVKIYSVYGPRAKAALKGLSHSDRISIRSIQLFPPHSHNGLRMKKLRRV